MNPATIYGGANTEVDLDEDEEEEDRRESRDGPEPGATLKPKITADQVEAVSMDVIEASKLSGEQIMEYLILKCFLYCPVSSIHYRASEQTE